MRQPQGTTWVGVWMEGRKNAAAVSFSGKLFPLFLKHKMPTGTVTSIGKHQWVPLQRKGWEQWEGYCQSITRGMKGNQPLKSSSNKGGLEAKKGFLHITLGARESG